MLIGYARVSTNEQDTTAQASALKAAGCERIFQGLEEDDARTYFEKLCPESPKAVCEATRWTVPIDRVKVSGPILVVSRELHHLTPPAIGRSLATFYGADYRCCNAAP
jgi:hypothetical protein